MTKQEEIEEMSKFVCNACEMKFCIDGACAVGNDYKTCGISQETAEYIYNEGYRKIDEIRKETAKEILNILHHIGGCDATKEWDKGFDAAIDTAYKAISEKYGVEVEE